MASRSSFVDLDVRAKLRGKKNHKNNKISKLSRKKNWK